MTGTTEPRAHTFMSSDNDESYSIRHWADVSPGEVCFGHHRGVDFGPAGHERVNDKTKK